MSFRISVSFLAAQAIYPDIRLAGLSVASPKEVRDGR